MNASITAAVQALKENSCERAKHDRRLINRMAKNLADLLADVSGGDWNVRININHARGVVVIVRVIEEGDAA